VNLANYHLNRGLMVVALGELPVLVAVGIFPLCETHSLK